MRIQAVDDELVLDDDLVVAGDNASVLPRLPDGAFDLIYMDPPFNTGRAQARQLVVGRGGLGSAPGTGLGSGAGATARRCSGRSATTTRSATTWRSLEPRLARARELLRRHGTLYFHIDYREAHYCKLLLDEVFGRDAFLNELIWSYDYGAKPRRRWPAKHDTILVYVRTPGAHLFDADAVEREPYMAPGLVSAEKAARGKRPDRRLVSHDRPHQRPREDRISDAEARGRPAADGGGLLAAGGVVPGSVRRLGDARRGLPGARAAVRARRLEPGGDRGDALASG